MVEGKSHYLDCFSLQENVPLLRPLISSEHPFPLGQANCCGMRGVLRHWMIPFLERPEHFLFELDSLGENAVTSMVIRSGGSVASFPVRFTMSIDAFDPGLTPEDNFRRMLCGPAGRAFRRLSKDPQVVASEPAAPAPVVAESDLPPPHEASYVATRDAVESFVATLLALEPDTTDVIATETAKRRGGRGRKRAGAPDDPVSSPDSPVVAPRLFDWTEEATKAVDAIVSQLPVQPHPVAAARLVAEVRRAHRQKLAMGARRMDTTWAQYIAGQRMTPRKARQVEADLRDLLMGYGSTALLEELDAKVMFIFMQSGPMLFEFDPTRHDARTRVALRQPGRTQKLSTVARWRREAAERLESAAKDEVLAASVRGVISLDGRREDALESQTDSGGALTLPLNKGSSA